MNLITELIIRVILIISLIDGISFYLITKHSRAITIPLAIGIIAITIISLLINTLFCLHRRGIK